MTRLKVYNDIKRMLHSLSLLHTRVSIAVYRYNIRANSHNIIKFVDENIN